MDRASRALRRGSFRLQSINSIGDHTDLRMVISEMRGFRKATKSLAALHTSVAGELSRWADSQDNAAIKDCFQRLSELYEMFNNVQMAYVEELKKFNTHWDAILEQEKMVDYYRSQLISAEKQENKLRKELAKINKQRNASSGEVDGINMKLVQAVMAKDDAEINLRCTVEDTEERKLRWLKQGLLDLSDAGIQVSAKTSLIFQAQKDLALQLPEIPADGEGLALLQYSGSQVTQQVVTRTKSLINRPVPPQTDIDPPPPYEPPQASCPAFDELDRLSAAMARSSITSPPQSRQLAFFLKVSVAAVTLCLLVLFLFQAPLCYLQTYPATSACSLPLSSLFWVLETNLWCGIHHVLLRAVCEPYSAITLFFSLVFLLLFSCF